MGGVSSVLREITVFDKVRKFKLRYIYFRKMVEEEVLSVRKQLEKISSGEADNAQVFVIFHLINLYIESKLR